MLHLNFALNLEHLADTLIDAVTKAWTTPFESPVVIFPDPKLEQWFRLRWIQKKGTLAGFNSMMIDRFLMEILVGDDTSKTKLNAEMLCNVILAYLQQSEGGEPNYTRLGDEVKRYLIVDGKLDETHLFDFATKMATLFLDYEVSRPANFVSTPQGTAPGILDKWHLKDSEHPNGMEPFFSANTRSDVCIREKWQQKLYAAIFHPKVEGGQIVGDSLLTQVFKRQSERKNDQYREYLTIPYLYAACLDKDGNANFHLKKFGNTPLFIFGLSGMGQFYRVILQKFAVQHEVFAFIQNPCMEFWEDAVEQKNGSAHRKWIAREGVWKTKDSNQEIPTIKERMTAHLAGDVTAEIAEENGEQGTDPEDFEEYSNRDAEQENALLCNWGRSGRENIKLWCQAADYDFDFSVKADGGMDFSEQPADTLLQKLQHSIAGRSNMLDELPENTMDGSLDVTAAPSRIREMENLHTAISKLLRDGARISDILVVSPCLDDYRTAIKTVFDQTAEKKSDDEKKAETGYLHIPFSIVDSPAKSSLTQSALENLFAILEGGTITRPDFFGLVRNPVVQHARHLDPDEIDNWEKWIEETNVYRDRDGKENWLRGVQRLLLAKMTKNPVMMDDGEDSTLMPYSDMATSNSNSLCKFVECIDQLKSLLEFRKDEYISDLDKLQEHLNAWLSMENAPSGFGGETIIYHNIIDAVEGLYNQLDAGLESISWKIVEQSLLTASESSEYSCGNLFVNGITFTKFTPSRIIPVKHLFFIGADSVSFPGAKQRNTLDLRKSCRPWPGDDTPVAKRRYGFLCMLMSAKESFHLSYVNQDIKKDADLYPSSVIGDISQFLKNSGVSDWKEIKVSIDEKRDFSDLFTPKSLRNKKAYLDMLHDGFAHAKPNEVPKNLDTTSTENITVKTPDRISLYKLRGFLEDPFQFRINQMMSDDSEDDPEKEVFEPVSLSRLDESSLLKMFLAAELSGKGDELKKFKRNSELKGNLPDGAFGQKLWKKMEAQKNLILEKIGPEKIRDIQSSWAYQVKIQDLQLTRSDLSKWNLSGSLDWCDNKDVENITTMMAVSTSQSGDSTPKLGKLMGPYVKALAILASKKGEGSKTVNIEIYNCCPENLNPWKASVSMTPQEARETLEAIYVQAFGDETQKTLPYSKSVPVDLLDEDDIDNLFDYRDKIKGCWKYFGKAALFDPLKDTGFSNRNFKDQWKEAKDLMKGLMKIKIVEEEQ
ncbi:MAG: exodeoxyribonuclease V subunit gamma [Fibrobacter sp.]|nr:exodeoxyribonuclease V subunit gamma [Fibrobacter sp.]